MGCHNVALQPGPGKTASGGGVSTARLLFGMPFLDTRRQRAALLIFVLGLGLAYALWPFSSGLMGALVLYVVFGPAYHELVRRGVKPGLAAGVVVLVALVLVVGPGISFIGLIANEAQGMAAGVLQSPLLARLRELRLGPYDIGAQIEALGSQVISWAGSSALRLVGTATRLGIQLTISFFGLFYLLVAPAGAWQGIRPFIPFSTENAEILRKRFRDVTFSTLIGTGLTAAVQGLLVGLAFWATGLSNAVFWGVVTVIVAILPVVGSGLIWGPGRGRARRGRAIRRGDRACGLGHPGGGQRRQPHPSVRLPAVGADPPVHHRDRRLRGNQLVRAGRPAHRAAGHLVFLRADPDVSGRVFAQPRRRPRSERVTSRSLRPKQRSQELSRKRQGADP